MKTQMKTQNAKLNFRKDSIIELNEAQLLDVDGGTSPVCFYVGYAALASSGGCGAVVAAAIGGAIGYSIATAQ